MDAVRRAPRIAGIVLAGGRSTRYGERNKLLEKLDGAPLVVRAVQAALSSRAAPVIVVTGHEAQAVEIALAGLDVRIVHNPDYAEGLSTSLKAGIAALPDDVDGAIVSLGDMPRIEARHLDRLISGFSTGPRNRKLAMLGSPIWVRVGTSFRRISRSRPWIRSSV